MTKMEFDFTGEQLKEIGMDMAAETAEGQQPGFKEKALDFISMYAKSMWNAPFMCEDVRKAWEDNGNPPTKNGRAWGAIISRAAREGIIVHVGYNRVSNPKAHRANASVWRYNK